MNKIAIVGSGPTGIYTAKYLLEQNGPLSITMFELQEEAGKGTPYHQDWNEEEMLSNIASIEIPPVTETLVEWLRSNSNEALAAIGLSPEDIHERTFFPRVVLGNYFQAQLEKLLLKASCSNKEFVVKTRHKVLDIRVEENGIELAVKPNGHDAFPRMFDYVVMATGHAWPSETEVSPGYFLSPWPASTLKVIGNCRVGIRGTSLSAIDAAVALSFARGVFGRDAKGILQYHAKPGTEAFRITMMSRKGVLPEADFYHPIPYLPLSIFTPQAIDRLIETSPQGQLLDSAFSLFKAELMHSDPAYAESIGLESLALEAFEEAYFRDRMLNDPFEWAERNLAEAKTNMARKFTVPWRYTILRMHEVVARIVPKLSARNYRRFNAHMKPVFMDDYATVPHESIERLLALRHAGKLDIIALGKHGDIVSKTAESGVLLHYGERKIHFPAFIEATGQRTLSVREFPFPSLWKQGIVHAATVPHLAYTSLGQRIVEPMDIGGVALDDTYHPVSSSPLASRLYCLSLPFLLSQFPFAQGITSSNDMGKDVAHDIGTSLSSTNELQTHFNDFHPMTSDILQ